MGLPSEHLPSGRTGCVACHAVTRFWTRQVCRETGGRCGSPGETGPPRDEQAEEDRPRRLPDGEEEWAAEGTASHLESDFEESEEVPLKRKSSRRPSGALRIDDVGERRCIGGRGSMEEGVDVNARAAIRRGGGSAATQHHRVPLPHVGVAAQGIGQGIASRSPAQELRGAATGIAAHAAEGARAGVATAGGASHAGEGGRSVGAATAVASHAAEGARWGGGNVGEGSRAGAVAGVGEDDEALVNRVRQRNTREGIDAASKLWVDDIRFWNETEGNAIVKLMQEARLYLIAVARGVQPPTLRRSIVLPHTTIPQHKIDDESEFSVAEDRALKVQQGYHAAYGYALNHAAIDIARTIWMGEEWRVCVSPMVFHITLDMDMKLPMWFVGVYIKDMHENDELAAYQEASVQRLVSAFTSAVSTAEAVDGGRVSHERLKSIADVMRTMLAATMWLMRMCGDDHRVHYDPWVFVQLTAKPTLIASMHRSFDARRHIVQAATAITDKLAKPPMTLVAPPLYIPDRASIGVKFSQDATLSSPIEAQKLDWLGTGPPEDVDDEVGDDERSVGGS
ncbi:hypothetical protein CBR_g31891 [Chara braunii]|uniref:Uncharacterized protein n=1 Tax=Chara braunii TaxID=69332 RepID=A0A388LFY5_CHABU|nr:hypothetical protein CBR_g31891 [Chara braunii]|eukprot:GBG81219.1 hypothetical protein CBR_g31891 [Chara braunii]